MINRTQPWLPVAAVAAFSAAQLVHATVVGPDWVEDGDAGPDLETAQVIDAGKGALLQRITGRLTGTAVQGEGDFVDLYQILVSDPTSLQFSTIDTDTNFQSSLWLFDESGLGLLGNVFAFNPDIAGEFGPIGSLLQNFATDETGIVINSPGIYYIAICGIGRVPVSGGNDMFFFSMSDEVSGPDGEGGGGMLGGWAGEGATGDYEILVEGVGFVPAPGALSLLAIGVLGAIGRRRRA